eukprot:Colp12_sorted_trinity150504_noHs@17181
MAGSDKKWLPLESNPEVMNKFVHNLGLGNEWGYTDVWGLDPDLLAMIPQPVVAVLLLFPITDKYEAFRKEEEQELLRHEPPKDVYFLRQYVGNACGTIGLLHSIANNAETLKLGGYLQEFVQKTTPLSAEERGHYLSDDEGITTAHSESAAEGQTEAPTEDEEVNLHFVCFVQKNGRLYELDGRKPRPVDHGPSSADSLLADAAKVVQTFMEREPDNLNFTVIALTKPEN